MIWQKTDSIEVKTNIAKIYDALKKVCDLYGLELEYYKNSYTGGYFSGERFDSLEYIYKTNIQMQLASPSKINRIIKISGGKTELSEIFGYKIYFMPSIEGYWKRSFSIKNDRIFYPDDLFSIILTEFKNFKIFTKDEMIIKDIIE